MATYARPAYSLPGPSPAMHTPAHLAAAAAPPPAAPAPRGTLPPGTRVSVGQYEVLVERFLSEGGFAHVYLTQSASPIPAGSPIASTRHVLKRMIVPHQEGLREVKKEVQVMKLLNGCRKIVGFIEASASELRGGPPGAWEIYILMEWCAGGGIIDMMNTRLQNRLTESEILKLFSDVVEAVAHMHYQNPPQIHRDLKVENVLMAGPGSYKLCDFGSTTTPVKKVPTEHREIQKLEEEINRTTTLQYRAPELVDVYSRKGWDEKIDIWALGVFLYKLCYYTTPFEEHGPLAILNVSYKIPPYPAYSNAVKGLIGSMLQERAASRPNIYQVHERVAALRGAPVTLANKYASSSVGTGPSIPSSRPTPNSFPASSSALQGVLSSTPPAAVPTAPLPDIAPMRRGRPGTTGASAGGKGPSSVALGGGSASTGSTPVQLPGLGFGGGGGGGETNRMVRTGLASFEAAGAGSRKVQPWDMSAPSAGVANSPKDGFGDSFAPSAASAAAFSSAARLGTNSATSTGGPGVGGAAAGKRDVFAEFVPQSAQARGKGLSMNATALSSGQGQGGKTLPSLPSVSSNTTAGFSSSFSPPPVPATPSISSDSANGLNLSSIKSDYNYVSKRAKLLSPPPALESAAGSTSNGGAGGSLSATATAGATAGAADAADKEEAAPELPRRPRDASKPTQAAPPPQVDLLGGDDDEVGQASTVLAAKTSSLSLSNKPADPVPSVSTNGESSSAAFESARSRFRPTKPTAAVSTSTLPSPPPPSSAPKPSSLARKDSISFDDINARFPALDDLPSSSSSEAVPPPSQVQERSLTSSRPAPKAFEPKVVAQAAWEPVREIEEADTSDNEPEAAPSAAQAAAPTDGPIAALPSSPPPTWQRTDRSDSESEEGDIDLGPALASIRKFAPPAQPKPAHLSRAGSISTSANVKSPSFSPPPTQATAPARRETPAVAPKPFLARRQESLSTPPPASATDVPPARDSFPAPRAVAPKPTSLQQHQASSFSRSRTGTLDEKSTPPFIEAPSRQPTTTTPVPERVPFKPVAPKSPALSRSFATPPAVVHLPTSKAGDDSEEEEFVGVKNLIGKWQTMGSTSSTARKAEKVV